MRGRGAFEEGYHNPGLGDSLRIPRRAVAKPRDGGKTHRHGRRPLPIRGLRIVQARGPLLSRRWDRGLGCAWTRPSRSRTAYSSERAHDRSLRDCGRSYTDSIPRELVFGVVGTRPRRNSLDGVDRVVVFTGDRSSSRRQPRPKVRYDRLVCPSGDPSPESLESDGRIRRCHAVESISDCNGPPSTCVRI